MVTVSCCECAEDLRSASGLANAAPELRIRQSGTAVQVLGFSPWDPLALTEIAVMADIGTFSVKV
jgi:hypothetical protein